MSKPFNRRRVPRRVPKRSTKVMVHKGVMGLGPNVGLSILDLSESGIRLMVKDLLDKGKEVEISLDSVHHRKPIKVQGTVIWCIPAADGRYIAAIQFHRGLAYGDILLLATT